MPFLNPKISEKIFATDKDQTGWRRHAATLIVSAVGAYKVFPRGAMACYARSLACPVGINTGSNGHKKYRPSAPAPRMHLARGLPASVAKKVGPPWLFLLVFLIVWFCPFFSLAEADVTEGPKVQSNPKKSQTGKASYYCKKFHGGRTASGKIFNRHELVAAHPSFPFGTLLLVTNLGNNRQVKVRVVDRGPSKSHRARGIIIDLSRGAAEKLGMIKKGRVQVKIEVLVWGKSKKIAGVIDGNAYSES